MLPETILLLANALFFMLRVAPGGGSFPKPLSAKDEMEALEQMAAGNPDAKARLIEHNLRLVAHVVKKYYAAREDQDDLISVGTIGLIKAVSTFKAEKKIKLATYAAKCIENAMLTWWQIALCPFFPESFGQRAANLGLFARAAGQALDIAYRRLGKCIGRLFFKLSSLFSFFGIMQNHLHSMPSFFNMALGLRLWEEGAVL